MTNALTAIDICAGAGGWACAARGLPVRIVAAIDIAADALATYTHNHPGVEAIEADVTEFDFKRFAGVDIVLGGIPCEEISQMRALYKPTPATMAAWQKTVDACLAAVKTTRPRYWCFEDVVALAKYLPPFTPYKVLDSARYSAQRRKRIFVGRFPGPTPPAKPCRQLLRHHLRPGPYRVNAGILGREPARHRVFDGQHFYPWCPERKSPTVIALTSRHDNYAAVVDGDLRRHLEWQELATLQGFPADYVFIGSPTRVTKLIAQAVQIDLGHAILAAMVEDALVNRDELKRQHGL